MELLRLDCKKIRLIQSHIPYKNTQPGSRLEGKFYNLYQFNGVAFTVEETDEFCSLLKDGKLFSVTLNETTEEIEVDGVTKTVPRLAMVNCISKTDKLEDARFEAEIESITPDNYKPAPISVESLEKSAGL